MIDITARRSTDSRWSIVALVKAPKAIVYGEHAESSEQRFEFGGDVAVRVEACGSICAAATRAREQEILAFLEGPASPET